MIDLHCHIIPGVDDGSDSMEESIEMARIAEHDGIEKIVATPHLFQASSNIKSFNEVAEERDKLIIALKENNIQIEIYPGAEVHISHNLIDEIRENREYITLNGSSYLFIEFPADHVFPHIKNLFFELMSEGITPIIAHPERNYVFIHNPELFFELIQMGALSQVNSGSFLGVYGTRIKDAAFRFLKLNLTHFIASDAHSTRTRVPRLSEAVKKAAAIIGEKNAFSLVRENPQAVLDDQVLPYIPTPVNPEERRKSLKIRIPNIFRK
jgi:protein-tyrosine phosphatase